MYWSNLGSVRKFTPIMDFFSEFGVPMFKFGDRPIYYMGNGFSVFYSQRMFTVENNTRLEYGDIGEYVLGIYYFNKKKDMLLFLKIDNGEYYFEGDILGEEFCIINKIDFNSTYDHVANYFKQNQCFKYYREGESRRLINGKLEFQNSFITSDNFDFFFFEKGKKSKISGFRFVFEG